MAFFRGIDGSLMVATNVLGQLKAWELNIDIKNLDTSAVGQAWATSVTEIGSWNGSLECYLDGSSGRAAQAALLAASTGATPGGAGIAIKFVAASTSGSPVSYFAGTVNVKQIQTGVKVGGVDMVKFTFQGTGELDITWA